MDIERMREFIVFSRYLNFTAAAKQLYISQPTLSYRVAAMEKELGLTLVERGTTLALTPSGKVFLAGAQEIVERYDAVLASCAAVAGRQEGRLVVESPTGMPGAAAVFDYAVSCFARANPAIEVKLTLTNGRRLADLLMSGAVDAGVVYDPECFDGEVGERMAFVPVFVPAGTDTRLCAFLPKSHPLALRHPLRAADFDGCAISLQSDPRYAVGRASIERLFARHGARVRFRDKTEKDGLDFLWGLGPDEVVVSDAGLLDLHGRSLASIPDRVVRFIEDDGLEVRPYLVFCLDNANPALRRLADAVSAAS